MKGIVRLGIVAAVVGGYFAVRGVVWQLFLGCEGYWRFFPDMRMCRRVDWWLSFLFAVPLTVLLVAATAIVVLAIVWVAAGFEESRRA